MRKIRRSLGMTPAVACLLAASAVTAGCGDGPGPDGDMITTAEPAAPTAPAAEPESVPPQPGATGDEETAGSAAHPGGTPAPETAAAAVPGGDEPEAGVTAGEDPAPPSAHEPPAAPPGGAANRDALPQPPETSAAVAEALATARSLREDGRRQEAVRALRAAEAELGDHPLLRLEAAWCFFEMAEQAFRANGDAFLVKGNLADAHLRLDQAMEMRADLPTAAVLLAKVLRYEEDPERATQVLEEHLARFPGDAAAHRELGDMARNARDWASADTHFSLAAQLDPADGRSRLAATIAKQWLCADDEAAYAREELHAGYRMAAKLLPDEDDPLRLLVGLYPNEPEARLAALDEVIADNPDAVWARVWKGYLLRGDDPEAALAVLAEAHRIAPDNTAVLVNRAETLAAMERWNDAALAYVTALETGAPGTLGPASDSLDALLHLGAQSAEISTEVRDRAYDALCAANPGEGRYGNNAGLWYRDVGRDYEKSLLWYQKAVDAVPNDQDYLNDTAVIYLFHLRDRKERSLPLLEKVRRLVEEEGRDPMRGYWDALENLCKYYYEVGRYEEVLACAALRADDAAQVGGRPYPSARAAAYANQARLKLDESR